VLGLEVIFWWALLVGVWELTLSGTTLPEICCEVAAALLSALGAVAARRTVRGRWVPKPTWLRWLPFVAASVLVDTTRVLWLAATRGRRRDVAGRLAAVQLLKSDDVTADSHRAYATLAITCTPGSVVYDGDADSHRLFTHTLVDGPPDLGNAVAR